MATAEQSHRWNPVEGERVSSDDLEESGGGSERRPAIRKERQLTPAERTRIVRNGVQSVLKAGRKRNFGDESDPEKRWEQTLFGSTKRPVVHQDEAESDRGG